MTTVSRSKTTTPGPTSQVEPPPRVIERLWGRYTIREDGCWISGYSTASHGYSQVGWQDRGRRHLWLAHRVAWFSENGSIPTGMTVDHMCRTRRCINPGHLRLMTNWDNARRNGRGEPDYPSEWSCRRNHPPERRSQTTGVCLDCHRISCRKYTDRKTGQV